MQVAGVGNVCLITILDVVSRLKVESYPCLDTTNPAIEAYQLMLRRAERVSQPKSLEANFSLVNARAFMPSAGEPFHSVIYTLCCKFHMCSSFSFRLVVLRNAFLLILASCPRSTRPI